MRLNPFSKEEKKDKKVSKKAESVEVASKEGSAKEMSFDIKEMGLNRTIKHPHISEKASMLANINQYVFRVTDSANKSEIKKQIQKLFKVNVVDVKILKMPKKRRDLGRHPGFKSGFKKAIVVLEKGQSIQQGQEKI